MPVTVSVDWCVVALVASKTAHVLPNVVGNSSGELYA